MEAVLLEWEWPQGIFLLVSFQEYESDSAQNHIRFLAVQRWPLPPPCPHGDGGPEVVAKE